MGVLDVVFEADISFKILKTKQHGVRLAILLEETDGIKMGFHKDLPANFQKSNVDQAILELFHKAALRAQMEE